MLLVLLLTASLLTAPLRTGSLLTIQLLLPLLHPSLATPSLATAHYWCAGVDTASIHRVHETCADVLWHRRLLWTS